MLEKSKIHFKNIATFALRDFESMLDHFSTLSMKGLTTEFITEVFVT